MTVQTINVTRMMIIRDWIYSALFKLYSFPRIYKKREIVKTQYRSGTIPIEIIGGGASGKIS
jgi:hypothetical protein